MADYRTALRTRIKGFPAVSAITAIVAWDEAPQGSAPPYVVLDTISDPRPEHMKGYNAARISRVQASCIATTPPQAVALAEAVIAACDGSPGVTAGVHFGRIKAEGPERIPAEIEGIESVFGQRVDLLPEHKLA